MAHLNVQQKFNQLQQENKLFSDLSAQSNKYEDIEKEFEEIYPTLSNDMKQWITEMKEQSSFHKDIAIYKLLKKYDFRLDIVKEQIQISLQRSKQYTDDWSIVPQFKKKEESLKYSEKNEIKNKLTEFRTDKQTYQNSMFSDNKKNRGKSARRPDRPDRDFNEFVPRYQRQDIQERQDRFEKQDRFDYRQDKYERFDRFERNTRNYDFRQNRPQFQQRQNRNQGRQQDSRPTYVPKQGQQYSGPAYFPKQGQKTQQVPKNRQEKDLYIPKDQLDKTKDQQNKTIQYSRQYFSTQGGQRVMYIRKETDDTQVYNENAKNNLQSKQEQTSPKSSPYTVGFDNQKQILEDPSKQSQAQSPFEEQKSEEKPKPVQEVTAQPIQHQLIQQAPLPEQKNQYSQQNREKEQQRLLQNKRNSKQSTGDLYVPKQSTPKFIIPTTKGTYIYTKKETVEEKQVDLKYKPNQNLIPEYPKPIKQEPPRADNQSPQQPQLQQSPTKPSQEIINNQEQVRQSQDVQPQLSQQQFLNQNNLNQQQYPQQQQINYMQQNMPFQYQQFQPQTGFGQQGQLVQMVIPPGGEQFFMNMIQNMYQSQIQQQGIEGGQQQFQQPIILMMPQQQIPQQQQQMPQQQYIPQQFSNNNQQQSGQFHNMMNQQQNHHTNIDQGIQQQNMNQSGYKGYR